MRLLQKKCMFVCIAAVLLLASTLVAGPIVGTLDLGGSVTVTGTTIDWLPAGPPAGVVIVDPIGPTSTGTFAGIGGTGVMLDLNSATNPAGVAWPAVVGFLLLTGTPNLVFDLQYINPGVYGSVDCFAPPAAGQNCTPTFPPPISPFNLTNLTASTSSVSLVLGGIVYDTVSGDVSSFTGIYTAQFGSDYQTLLATLAAGGAVSSSFSASLTANPIPEPGTIGLILIALAAVPLGRRFRGV